MPRSLCVFVDDPPYGSIQPAEAIRHARGALAKGWEVTLAFVDDGVYTLLPRQSPGPGEWICLAEAVAQFMEEGKGCASVLVDARSLEVRRLLPGDLVEGVRRASLDEIGAALCRCDRTLVF
jgi:sulfur relay (sulfurtransferase) DsrF/TusC family protein